MRVQDTIFFRLVYNRQNRLNRQGKALVQIETYLNGRKAYFSSGIYLYPEEWDARRARVINHPYACQLQGRLKSCIHRLQGIEALYWAQGKEPTLADLKDAVKNNRRPDITFSEFCRNAIEHSERQQGTKGSLLHTLDVLQHFRPGINFPDLTYTLVREFAQHLHSLSLHQNTVAKHLRNLRTLISESMREGYIPRDADPFLKFRIKTLDTPHDFLRPVELHRMEKLKTQTDALQHILDAFLFCCYTGFRFSDFCSLTTANIERRRKEVWIIKSSQKTRYLAEIPLHQIFGGKALAILDRYPSIEVLANIPNNADSNVMLRQLSTTAGIKRHITWHISRHTCGSLLQHFGVPVTTVQKILGHTSVTTTQKYAETTKITIVKDLSKVNRRKQTRDRK